MKIKTFGFRKPPLDQLSRIDKGFLELGHELTDDNPDLVYSNNDIYDDVLEFVSKQKKLPFIILNVLDIQDNNPHYPLEKVKQQLQKADCVTSISLTTQKEVERIFNIYSHVIYNPIKPITYRPEVQKQIDFLIVGRNSAPSKNGRIFENLLDLPECGGRTFAAVGPEPLPHFQQGWLGILSDKQLEEVYNLSKFIICMSEREGMCMPMLEAMAAKCIPIVSNKMTTAWEFILPNFQCKPDPQSIFNKVKQLEEDDYESFLADAYQLGINYQNWFSGKTIAQNIIDLYNKYA